MFKSLVTRFLNLQLPYRLYLIATFFAVISILVIVVSPKSFQIFVYCAVAAYAIGFIIWSWPIVKSFWKSAIGKLVIVVSHLVILIFSTASARDLVAHSLMLPPQDFDLTVGLLALLLYIPTWGIVASLALAILFFLLYIASLAIGAVGRPLSKPLVHSLGVLMLFLIVMGALEKFYANEKHIIPFVRLAALFLDYHPAENYPGVRKGERVRLHENGIISVAELTESGVVISVRKLGD